MIRDLINTEDPTPATAKNVSRESPVTWIPLHSVYDNPFQPREHYDAEHILNLALSIKQLKSELRTTRGLQQLPLARLGNFRTEGQFVAVPRLLYSAPAELRNLLSQSSAAVQLMFGHSRLRAFRVLATGLAPYDPTLLVNQVDGHHLDSIGDLGIDLTGLAEWQTRYADLMHPDQDYETLPVALGYAEDVAMWRHAITENSQRKNINAIEEARAMAVAKTQFGLTDAQAAAPFGYARSTAANKIRLLDLPAEVQTAIATGQITERHGRELLRLAEDPVRLKDAFTDCVKQQHTVARLTQDVNWRAQALKEEQGRQRERDIAMEILRAGYTPPGSTAPMPAVVERIWPGGEYTTHLFESADDKKLLERGICGSHCECCLLTYQTYRVEHMVRPDPERAPHIVLTCTGSREVRGQKAMELERLREKGAIQPTQAEQRAAEEQAQKRREVQELEQGARQIWDKAIRRLNCPSLWQDIRFWRAAAPALEFGRMKSLSEGAESVQALQERILDAMFSNTYAWNSAIEARIPDVTKIDQLITALTQPTERPAQPGPGDSQTTNWQDGWDNDDQALYDDICAEMTGEGCWAETIEVLDDYPVLTGRVLLRLIEECGNKDDRGELWRRYNELAGTEEVSDD